VGGYGISYQQQQRHQLLAAAVAALRIAVEFVLRTSTALIAQT
jgi:hypothetical protein